MGTLFKLQTDGSGFAKLIDFAGVTNGQYPNGSLFSDGTFLYGMTSGGGTNNVGTIFKIKSDGIGFEKLLDFNPTGAIYGKSPLGSLFSDGIFMYGMTYLGGTNDIGAIFKIKPDGTGYAKLLDFTGTSNGRWPNGSLISDGTFLYGVTEFGGTNEKGVLFKIKPDGTGFSKLIDFDGFAGAVDGSRPTGSLIFDGIFLYGMTYNGGINDRGILFKIKTDGTGYAKLLDFTVANGSNPSFGSLISDGTFLYGVTCHGGPSGEGTLFKIKPDGTGFATMHDFVGNPNGTHPYAALISDGTFLYGMTSGGGTSSNNSFGIIFKIKQDGTGFAKLFDFESLTSGSHPFGALISDGTFLYGMTQVGGQNNKGTLFKIKPDGTGFAKLLDFTGTSNGYWPSGSLISDGNFLYGMTSSGGAANFGTIFKYQIGTTTDIHKETETPSPLTVYPNPNSGSFTIHSVTEGVYAILNELGQTIKIVKLNAENKYTLQVDNLSKGIYFMVDTQNGIPSKQKIVVMN
jgi:uncharacterized repeat protein (TIGR03803 family)